MNFYYKKASVLDLDILIKTRIEVLRAANELPEETDMSSVEQETAHYYRRCFTNDNHVAYLAYHNDLLVGCGGVSFYEVMPTFHNPTGKNAYIMNMYTKSDYRRRGIAFKILDLLVQEARQREIRRITLEATKSGRHLYDRYGFIAMKDEMIFAL